MAVLGVVPYHTAEPCMDIQDIQAAYYVRSKHAGSTDAVAYSLNGCRDQATAALHIALGDR